MSSSDAGTTTFWATVQIPDDTDPWDASSYSPGLAEVTDRTTWLSMFDNVGGVNAASLTWGMRGTGKGGTPTADPGDTGVIGTGGTSIGIGVLGVGAGGAATTRNASTGVAGTGGTGGTGGNGVSGEGTGIYSGVLGVGSGGPTVPSVPNCGVHGVGGTGGGPGVHGDGTGTGAGVDGHSGGTGAGVVGYGTTSGGAGTGDGVHGEGGTGGAGGSFIGGASAGNGVTGQGGAGGLGGQFTGGAGAAGAAFTGGAGGAVGLSATGTGSAVGVAGQGGATGAGANFTGGSTCGAGIVAAATTQGDGATCTAAGNGNGVTATASGNGAGVAASAASASHDAVACNVGPLAMLGAAGGAAPKPNRLYPDLIPKAWCHIQISGPGGVWTASFVGPSAVNFTSSIAYNNTTGELTLQLSTGVTGIVVVSGGLISQPDPSNLWEVARCFSLLTPTGTAVNLQVEYISYQPSGSITHCGAGIAGTAAVAGFDVVVFGVQ